ncbi:MAG: hypothetical protein CME93_06355 [Hyphomonadaceae bacterium]|nr:hypothetical protein [Hyphomonadaceae bacterium]OUX93816.1 MAG: hypothetical protein CBB77_07835 [Hyphomonas sp. TMED17]CAI8367809.1 MAG: Uncharacterised protein [Hyphomonas sp. TMED17]
MPLRLLFQLFFFLLPFIGYGLYRLAISNAAEEGRQAWPTKTLFGAGLILALISWFAFIVLDNVDRGYCYSKSQLVDGELIAGQRYVCDSDLSRVGVPGTDDPGGVAEGVGLDDNPDSTALDR